VEERRKNDSRIEVLSERVENWMSTTTEYRKALCAKMDILTDKMNNLPCRERIEHTRSIRLQLKALWVLVSAGLLGIISEWIKFR
jgi:hypothetical protein